MIRYSTESRDQVFVKADRFLPFATNIDKTLSGKYSQKLDHDTNIYYRLCCVYLKTYMYLIDPKIRNDSVTFKCQGNLLAYLSKHRRGLRFETNIK